VFPVPLFLSSWIQCVAGAVSAASCERPNPPGGYPPGDTGVICSTYRCNAMGEPAAEEGCGYRHDAKLISRTGAGIELGDDEVGRLSDRNRRTGGCGNRVAR